MNRKTLLRVHGLVYRVCGTLLLLAGLRLVVGGFFDSFTMHSGPEYWGDAVPAYRRIVWGSLVLLLVAGGEGAVPAHSPGCMLLRP